MKQLQLHTLVLPPSPLLLLLLLLPTAGPLAVFKCGKELAW